MEINDINHSTITIVQHLIAQLSREKICKIKLKNQDQNLLLEKR